LGVARGNNAFAAAHPAQGGGGLQSEFPRLGGDQVGDLVAFEVAPHVFHRIKFWGVSGQSFDVDAALGGQDIIAHQDAAVDGRPIPDDQYFSANMLLEMPEKLNDLEALDTAGVNLKIEPPQRQRPDDRETFPIERLLQDRGLPARSPGARPRGPRAQSAFVNEDNGPAFGPGFFFRAGHSTRCHLRMAFSSRSTARRSGRWQLKPLAPRIRHTCPG